MATGNGFRGNTGQPAAPPYTNGPYTFSEDITFSGTVTMSGTMVFGDAAVDTLTIGGTATISSNNKFYFRDTGLYLWSSADGQFDAVADTVFKVTAPTVELEASTAITLDGDVTVDAAHTFASGTGAVSLNGDVTVAATKTLYIRDASQSIASSSDNNMEITSPTLTLAGATKINLDGPVDVSGILTVDTTGSPADGIKINATTPTDGLEVASSCTNAINLSGTNTVGMLIAGASATGISMTGAAIGMSLSKTNASQTLENRQIDVAFTTDSTFVTGTDITYSGGRGSSAVKLVSTWTGASGGFSNIYSYVTASTNWAQSGDGVVGIKSVVLSDGVAITDGNLYGGQFIAKKSGANDAAAEVAVVGLESWFMETGSGEVRTGIGGNFGWHADSSDAGHTAGSVWRGVQIFCDSSGTSNAEETTGLYVWPQAGTLGNGVVVGVASGTVTTAYRICGGGTYTTGLKFGGTAIAGASNATVTTGIDMSEVTGMTKGLYISGTGGSASAKAITTSGFTLNDGNLTDGYGLVECDLTLTGNVAGAVAGLSSWINMASVTTGGNYVCAQTNGLWSDTGGVLTNGVFIFGMRAQCLLQTNGGASGAKFYPFSVVNNTNVTTAIFKCNAGSSDLGTTAVSKTTEGKYVPLYEDDAGVHYVLIYN